MIEKVAVALQVDDSARFQYMAILLHEPGGGEPFVDFLHLGIGKRDPYFRHLVLGEETVQELQDVYKRQVRGRLYVGPWRPLSRGRGVLIQ